MPSKKIEKKPEKKYYKVVVECQVPAIFTYRILAEDENEALELVNKSIPKSIQHHDVKHKKQKTTVYDDGTFTVKKTSYGK